jgi:aromatic ring-opening dioxygenase LigB subunit
MLEEIADDPRVMAKTRTAMKELGRRFAASRPDTVVVLTPHGMVVEGAISCGATPLAAGVLGDTPRQIQAAFHTDLVMVEKIFTEGITQQLPLARLVGEEKVDDAVLPLDWGALIPLWYTAHILKPRPKVVVIAPDRTLPRETLVRCGVAIARAAAASNKRVALIASCDQGHAHDPEGPYGYSPVSAEHDTAMCAAITENDLPRLLHWPEAFMDEARVDAYWQTIMLAGALGHTPMRGELLSYEAPTYFGMAVAAYTPSAV